MKRIVLNFEGGLDTFYSDSEVIYKAKKAGQKELGGFSIEDAIIEAFELGAAMATDTISEILEGGL
ncbi:hypothetical protein [Peptacetobacter sp.]|uniref:hypothetical protein n=1 Tax=Peptacetobacter sp. TaxID=2991975 RepID=UPI003AB3B0B6